MICPGCQAEVPDEDSFCENCGLRLGPPPEPAPACLCGASLGEADEDGFCQQCGHRVRRPASDHIEQAISPDLAGISDRGLHHDHNEDRFALVREARGVGLVVCDGVSSTSQAEVAAETVAQTIAAELRGILADDRPEAPLEEAAGTLLGAMAKGGAALEAQTTGNRWSTTAPSTTVVAAMVVGRELTVAWAGDSRAYWIGEDHQVEALTRDHSWLRVALCEGQLTAQEALGSPQAHAILRWVGGLTQTRTTGPRLCNGRWRRRDGCCYAAMDFGTMPRMRKNWEPCWREPAPLKARRRCPSCSKWWRSPTTRGDRTTLPPCCCGGRRRRYPRDWTLLNRRTCRCVQGRERDDHAAAVPG